MNRHLDPSTILQHGFVAVAPPRPLAEIVAELFPVDPPGLCEQARLHGEGRASYLLDHPLTANHTAQGEGARRRATESGARTQVDVAYADRIAEDAKGRKGSKRSTTYQRLRWFEKIDLEVLDEVEGSQFETVACLELLAKDSDVERQRRLVESWQSPSSAPARSSPWCGDRVPGIIDNPTRFYVPDVLDADGHLLVPSIDFWHNDSKRVLPRLHNAGRRFDLVACDPPYNVERVDSDGVGILGDGRRTHTERWAIPLSLRILSDDSYAYYAASAEVEARWHWTGEALKHGKCDEIVWDKQVPSGLGNVLASLNPHTERFLVVHKGSPKLRPHTRDGKLVQRDSDLWSIPAPRGKGFGDKHPSRKPPELFKRIYANASDEGDEVLDPFAGCAPSGVAAIRSRRRWLGVEAEQQWFDDGVRWLKDEIAARYPEHFGIAEKRRSAA